MQLSCPNTGIVAVPETDRWTGTLSNDEAKRWRVAEAAQWLRLLSRWPLAFVFCLLVARQMHPLQKYEGKFLSVANCSAYNVGAVLCCAVLVLYGQSRNSTT